MPTGSSGSVRVFYPRYDRKGVIKLLNARLPVLSQQIPLKRVVLFGSWAKGKATVFSDIDLMVIYADPPREDAYQFVRRCLDIPGLEPHVYSEQQASHLKETLDRMTKDGVVFVG
jgi:hypothetical protein